MYTIIGISHHIKLFNRGHTVRWSTFYVTHILWYTYNIIRTLLLTAASGIHAIINVNLYISSMKEIGKSTQYCVRIFLGTFSNRYFAFYVDFAQMQKHRLQTVTLPKEIMNQKVISLVLLYLYVLFRRQKLFLII